jgi:cytochrome bd-type quinol oxidase subunit 2
MASDDAIPDREQMRHAARRRTRRSWWLVAAMAVAALILTPVGVLITHDGPLTTGETIIVFVPVLVGILGGVVAAWWLRRRQGEPQLLAGADRGTRRAVWRAIRTGHPADARIDALAREAADRTVRNSWMLVMYTILLVLQLVLLVSRIAAAEGVGMTVLTGTAVACWAIALTVFAVARARSRRYLRAHPFPGDSSA